MIAHVTLPLVIVVLGRFKVKDLLRLCYEHRSKLFTLNTNGDCRCPKTGDADRVIAGMVFGYMTVRVGAQPQHAWLQFGPKDGVNFIHWQRAEIDSKV